jgi:hypothetical protein
MLTLVPGFGPAICGDEEACGWMLVGAPPAGGRLATLWACAATATPVRNTRLRTAVLGEYRISIRSIFIDLQLPDAHCVRMLLRANEDRITNVI